VEFEVLLHCKRISNDRFRCSMLLLWWLQQQTCEIQRGFQGLESMYNLLFYLQVLSQWNVHWFEDFDQILRWNVHWIFHGSRKLFHLLQQNVGLSMLIHDRCSLVWELFIYFQITEIETCYLLPKVFTEEIKIYKLLHI
jgi:hypothetical protein